MKQRVADYIADFLVSKGIDTVFTVVGGGAMHLNDAFGKHQGLRVFHNHHEQACAMAAEGYARECGKPAAVCVTTGPGGTNAMTGVLGAYQDNVPMIVISGQVRYAVTVESTGLNLRQFGPQEYCIIESVKPMTKYANIVRYSGEIRVELEKAYHIALSGNKGPVWLDIPLNIQGDVIETDELIPYEVNNENRDCKSIARDLIRMLKEAERPLILAGAGIRRANIHEEFTHLVSKLNIPVVVATCVADILPLTDRNYYGNFGVAGGRVGNFLVQNADVILSLGVGFSFLDTSFNYESFSPDSYKIMVSSDIDETKKPNVHIDYPVIAATSDMVLALLTEYSDDLQVNKDWLKYAETLKKEFDLFDNLTEKETVNPYFLIRQLMDILPDRATVVTGNSSGSAMALHYGIIKAGQRLFGNVNCGSMGWDLPAAIGAAVASRDNPVVCLTGDGSIQMNLQELQTVVRYKIPLKILIYSNGGYMGIVRTQTAFFDGRLTGCTPETGLDFPDFQAIAQAYRIPYMKLAKAKDLDVGLQDFLSIEGYAMCELVEDSSQGPAFKLESRKMDNGEMVSAAFDDLSPLLDRSLYEKYEKYENFILEEQEI